MSRFVAGILVLSLLLSVCAIAAEGPATAKPKPVAKKKAPTMAEQLQALQNQINQQQSQVKQQQDQINTLQQQLQQSNSQLQAQGQQLQSSVQQANQSAAAAQQAANSLNSSVADLKSTTGNLEKSMAATQKAVKDLESPLAVHYKGVTFSPGGWTNLNAEFQWRNGNNIEGMSYSQIPLLGSTNSKMHEFRIEDRSSRIAFRADTEVKGTKVLFYYDMDFQAQPETANETQTYSYSPRVRDFFVQTESKSGWMTLTGNTWDLMTPMRKGMSALTEAIPISADFNIHIGYPYVRAPLARVIKNFNNKVWVGVEIMNPATVDSTAAYTLPAAGKAAVSLTSGPVGGNLQFFYPVSGFSNSPNTLQAASGTASPTSGFVGAVVTQATPTCTNTVASTGAVTSTCNPITPNQTGGYPATNVAPDLHFKVAFEPGWGHWEAKALIRWFQDRPVCNVFQSTVAGNNGVAGQATACANGTAFDQGKNNFTTGYGYGINAVLPIVKNKVDFTMNTLFGKGIGRYSPMGYPDVTLKPDGTMAAVPVDYVAFGLELHPKANLDVYAYMGDEYAGRTIYPVYLNQLTGLTAAQVSAIPTTAGGQVGWMGYGVPTVPQTLCATESTNVNPACTTYNRNAYQVNVGFWHRFWRGPQGTLQWGLMYEYMQRQVWSGLIVPQTTGAAPTLGATTSSGTIVTTTVATTGSPAVTSTKTPLGNNWGAQATIRYYLP